MKYKNLNAPEIYTSSDVIPWHIMLLVRTE